MPLISVILPFYNANNQIIKTLNNLSSRLDENFEIIIIDDGSSDESSSLAEQYAKKRYNFFIIDYREIWVHRLQEK